MNNRVDEIAERINELMDELAEEFPEQGFLIAALTPLDEDETQVTAVTNVSDEDLPALLEGIFEGDIEPAHVISKRLN